MEILQTMKTTWNRNFLFLTVTFFLLPFSLLAQSWVHTGPTSEMVETIAVSPVDTNIVYLGTFWDGIQKTEDGGRSWNSFSSGIPLDTLSIPQVRELILHPVSTDTLWCIVADDVPGDFPIRHLYVSHNEAETWLSPSSGWDGKQTVSLLPPGEGRTCLVANAVVGDEKLLFRSDDGGISWDTVGVVEFTTPIVADPNNALHLIAVDGKLTYHSFDGGVSWTSYGDEEGELTIHGPVELNSSYPERMFSLAKHDYQIDPYFRVVTSIDSGKTWDILDNDPMPLNGMIRWEPSGRLWSFDLGAPCYSDDLGANWTWVDQRFKTYPNSVEYRLAAVEFNPLNYGSCWISITTLAEGLLLKTVDRFASVSLPQRENHSIEITRVKFAPSNPEIIHALTAKGHWRSTDGGEEWELLSFHHCGDVGIHSSNPQILLQGYSKQEGSPLQRSADSGESWTTINEITGWIDRIVFHPLEPDVAFLSASDASTHPSGWFRSEDAGQTWTYLPTAPFGPYGAQYEIDPDDGVLYERLYDAESDGVLYRSGDLGDTWQQLGTTEGKCAYTVESGGPRQVISSAAWGTVVSYDDGETFTDTLTVPKTSDSYAIIRCSRETPRLLTGVLGDSVYASWDGVTWQSWSVPTESLRGAEVLADDKILCWTAGDGMWLSEEGLLSVETPEANLPKVFQPPRVFPNPFNSSVTVEYVLPHTGKISIVVFDQLGRRVRQLQAGNEKSGVHRVYWDGKDSQGGNVASSVYFIRYQFQKEVGFQRVVLVK